jgi:hypothetical protein
MPGVGTENIFWKFAVADGLLAHSTDCWWPFGTAEPNCCGRIV